MTVREQTPAIGSASFTALVMAGSRPAGDPLAQALGVPFKALITVDGITMIARVVRALMDSAHVGRIVVIGLEREQVELPSDCEDHVELVPAAATPGASAAKVIRDLGLKAPLLITTADHPLLTPQMVDELCRTSLASSADVSLALAQGPSVTRIFPGIRRTHHKFRDGAYCGCNLFCLLTPAGREAPSLWMQVEQHRKKPWRLLSLLGSWTVVRYLLGWLSLADVVAIGKAKLGLVAQPVILSDAVAGFDVDTVEQRNAAEAYLKERRGASS